jgi:hypothetical protein
MRSPHRPALRPGKKHGQTIGHLNHAGHTLIARDGGISLMNRFQVTLRRSITCV